MQLAFTLELTYLIIGLVVGAVLGINLSMLYNRIFRRQSSHERKLENQVRDLEHRLQKKDDYIAKAIKAERGGRKNEKAI